MARSGTAKADNQKRSKNKLHIIFTKMKKIKAKVERLIFTMMMKAFKIDLALYLKGVLFKNQ